MEIEFLGTGTSSGIPVIGCKCDTCLSSDIKDKRYRSSLKIEKDNKVLIIDTGPEFRLSALRSNISRIDAVLYTHNHYDHIFGLDDLKALSKNKSLPIYSNQRTLDSIKTVFPYCFSNLRGVPNITLNHFNYYETKLIENFKVINVPIFHGNEIISSYRIDDLVYLTDCSDISKKSKEVLKKPKLLIIGALRYKPHHKHFNVDQAIEISKELESELTIFTHINHNIKHSDLSSKLPSNIIVGYDTLKYNI